MFWVMKEKIVKIYDWDVSFIRAIFWSPTVFGINLRVVADIRETSFLENVSDFYFWGDWGHFWIGFIN